MLPPFQLHPTSLCMAPAFVWKSVQVASIPSPGGSRSCSPGLLLVPLETLNRTEFSDHFISVGVEESKPRQTCVAPMSKKNNLKTRKNAHEFHLQREKELEQKRAAKRERKQSAAENKVRARNDRLEDGVRRRLWDERELTPSRCLDLLTCA